MVGGELLPSLRSVTPLGAHPLPRNPQYDASNASAWIKFTKLETILQDTDRARAIYELAVNQPSMDMPELIWKSWIDFEFEEEEYSRVRELYERLLRRTSHVKVWVSYAQFEANAGRAEEEAIRGGGEDEEEDEEVEKVEKEAVEVDEKAAQKAKEDGLERARKVFQRGYDDLRKKGLKEEVSAVLLSFSPSSANADCLSRHPTACCPPRSLEGARIGRGRRYHTRQGRGHASSRRQEDAQGRWRRFHDGGVYVSSSLISLSFARSLTRRFSSLVITIYPTTDYDMLFADDETAGANPASLKFLQLAAEWKKKAALAAPAPAEEESEEEEESDDEEEHDEE